MTGWESEPWQPNNAVEQTAGSHSLAAAAHRERWGAPMTFGSVLLLVLVLVAVWFVFRGTTSGTRASSALSDPVGGIQGPGNYEIEVVGESHYQRALESICGGRTEYSAEKYVQATLVLEDQNPHDSQAVRVDVSEMTVGYLPRDTARSYRRRLREAGHPRLTGRCNAVIRGGWDRGPQDRGHFGVWLDLPSK